MNGTHSSLGHKNNYGAAQAKEQLVQDSRMRQKGSGHRQEPEKTTVQSAYRPSVGLNAYKGPEPSGANAVKDRRNSKASARQQPHANTTHHSRHVSNRFNTNDGAQRAQTSAQAQYNLLK